MKLLETLKADIRTAVKANDKIRRDVLKYVVSEVEALDPKKLTEESIYKLMNKTILANNECISMGCANDVKDKLLNEVIILQSYIPKTLSFNDLTAFQFDLKEVILGAKSDGQATGLAIKWLKENTDFLIDGTVVTSYIKELRGGK